jgi:hypothetical protein
VKVPVGFLFVKLIQLLIKVICAAEQII